MSLLIRYVLVAGLLILRPLLQRVNWPIIIAVNAGDDRDITTYTAGWLAGFLRSERWYAIGFYRIQGFKIGLVVGAPYGNNELQTNPDFTRGLTRELQLRWKAQKFALTGMLPSCMNRHSVWPDEDERFVSGGLGTQHLICENIQEVFALHPVIQRKPIAVVGCGYTGRQVIRNLSDIGYEVRAIDIQAPNSDLPPGVHSPADAVAECGLIVLLTPTGNGGISSIRSLLRPGMVVLSDTHPKVSLSVWRTLRQQEVMGYECGCWRPGSRFIPKLPRWGSDNLLGCVMQALVELETGERPQSQIRFSGLAGSLGIISRVELPLRPQN